MKKPKTNTSVNSVITFRYPKKMVSFFQCDRQANFHYSPHPNEVYVALGDEEQV